MTDELKPCPFCGGEAALRKINVNEYVAMLKPRYSYEVQCLDCQVSTQLHTFKKKCDKWLEQEG